MAALLIACGACLTERFSKKRQAKKEREAEYAANFESLKAENAKRVYGMSTQNLEYESQRTSYTSEMGEPPKYDAVNGMTARDFAQRPQHTTTQVTGQTNEAPQRMAHNGAMTERGRRLDRNAR